MGSDPELMNQLAAVARRLAYQTGDSSVREAEVYGPASQVSVEQALDRGDPAEPPAAPDVFYLVVLRGDFVAPNAVGPRSQLRHYTTAAQTWSPLSGYLPSTLRLANDLPSEVSRLDGPTLLSLSHRQAAEHGSGGDLRYQVLDHAAHESPLWDCRGQRLAHPTEGGTAMLHRERAPDDLRPELRRLLKARLVKLYEKTDTAGFHSLTPEDAIEVLADDRNWYAPYDRDRREGRSTIYALGLSDSGRKAFQRDGSQHQST